MIKPGLMLSCELPPADLQRLAQLAEDVDYGHLWYTDQRFWRDSYMGLAQIAEVTSRIKIGPGVNDPFTRHPALIAMSIATLDEQSQGRAVLGLGVGGSGIAQMNLPKPRPVRALREAIEIIRAMLTGDSVNYQGEIFQLSDAKLGFQPLRQDIPIFVATHGPQVLKLSSKIADGILLGNMGSREAINWATGIVQENTPADSAVEVHLRMEAIISEDSDAAFAFFGKRLAHRLRVSYPYWGFLGNQRERLDPGIEIAAKNEDEPTIASLLSHDDIRSSALVGNPEEVAEQLRGMLTSHVKSVTIRPYSAGEITQDATVQLFAEQVWPTVMNHAVT